MNTLAANKLWAAHCYDSSLPNRMARSRLTIECGYEVIRDLLTIATATLPMTLSDG